MPQPLSFDLRSRVLAAVDAGLSYRQAAERFGVSAASAIQWAVLRRGGGDVRPKPQGGDRLSHKTEAHADLIHAVLDDVPNINPAGAEGAAGRPRARVSVTALYDVDPTADFDAMDTMATYATGLVCAQRELREPLTTGGDPVCFVGGCVLHTVVSRTVVLTVRGVGFPDEAGRRITAQRYDATPSPSGRAGAPLPAPAGMTRQQRRA